MNFFLLFKNTHGIRNVIWFVVFFCDLVINYTVSKLLHLHDWILQEATVILITGRSGIYWANSCMIWVYWVKCGWCFYSFWANIADLKKWSCGFRFNAFLCIEKLTFVHTGGVDFSPGLFGNQLFEFMAKMCRFDFAITTKCISIIDAFKVILKCAKGKTWPVRLGPPWPLLKSFG